MSKLTESEPEPTRPTWKWLLVAVIAVAVIEVVTNWSEISAFAHLPEIGHSLGIG